MKQLKLSAVIVWSGMVACSATPPPRTPGMEALGVSTTTSELRFHVYRYESVFAAAVQTAADKIALEEEAAYREVSIRWKINSIPAMQAAPFQLDPLAAFADAWGLTAQMERFFSVGAGKDIFGDSQHIAVDASRELVAEIRSSNPRSATRSSGR